MKAKMKSTFFLGSIKSVFWKLVNSVATETGFQKPKIAAATAKTSAGTANAYVSDTNAYVGGTKTSDGAAIASVRKAKTYSGAANASVGGAKTDAGAANASAGSTATQVGRANRVKTRNRCAGLFNGKRPRDIQPEKIKHCKCIFSPGALFFRNVFLALCGQLVDAL